MNDFTKEELEFIKVHLKFGIDYHRVINVPFAVSLPNKIQSMIDSYCEHEWCVSNKEFHASYAKCSKCGINYDNHQ